MLRVGAYRRYFYRNEKGGRPHIHVQREQFLAKFWLNPVALAWSKGFASHELRSIQQHVEADREIFLEAWNEQISS